MTLQDIFDALTYGELSQIALGEGSAENAEPGMCETRRTELMSHIELGLMALYKRFRLSTKTVKLQLVENQQLYLLDAKYARTNTQSIELVKYLIDDQDKFDNTLLKIEEVKTLDNIPLALNVANNPHSLRTPNYKTLLLPSEFGLLDNAVPEQLVINYRAGHPKLDLHRSIAAPQMTVIDLPGTHLQALLYYIASRVFNPVGMVQEFHTGNSYFGKYENECQRLGGEDTQIDDQDQNHHFETGGWV